MSQVYGFRGYQPRAAIYRHPFTGAVIATPVLDLSSERGPQGYADRSGTGANGAPVGAPACTRGVYGNAIKLGGVRDTLTCGSNAPLDVAGNISVFCWTKAVAPAALSILAIKTNGVSGWYLGVNGAGRTQVYFYNGGAVLGGGAGVPLVTGRLAHTGFTVLGTVGRAFVDGLEFVRGAVTMSDDAASSLYVGSAAAGGNWLEGLIELVQEWNGTLSPEQVYRNYLAAKDVPIYYDTFEGYAVTPVAKAAGSMCGPFRVASNFMSITVDANGKKWVQGGSAGLYSYSFGTWPENCAYGTWELDEYIGAEPAVDHLYFMPIATLPVRYGTAPLAGYLLSVTSAYGLILYRVTGGAAAVASLVSIAGIVPTDVQVTFRIVRRVDGQFTIYIKGGPFTDWLLVDCTATGTTNPVVDNTHTTSGYSNVVARVTSKLSNIKFTRVCERPASFPWEFSATGTWAGLVSAGQVWMRCLTSGNVYLPKDLDWQACDLKLYKGADANVTDVLLVATELGGTTTASQNGYCLRLSADERVQLCRMDNGAVTVLAQTAAAYVALTTEYSFHVTRVGTTGAFTVSILGGAYAVWTEAVTATDNTYTSGNYFNVDIDADDRITAPVFAAGLKATA